LSFKITIEKAKQFQDRINLLAVLVDEATLQFTPEKITVCHIDPSRIAMINMEMPNTDFKEYVCETPCKIGINVSELQKLLKRAGKDETITLTYDKTGKLHLKITGKYTRNFTMSTLEASEEEIPTPKICYNVKAKIVTAGLNQAIEDTQLVGDQVKIRAEQDTITLAANSDLMSADITLQKGADILLDLEIQDPKKASCSTYCLSYLSEIVKAAGAISDLAVLEFASDMPVHIDFAMQEGKAEFWLAPRISTES
jgi:proliferating cell nuclear antigen